MPENKKEMISKDSIVSDKKLILSAVRHKKITVKYILFRKILRSLKLKVNSLRFKIGLNVTNVRSGE